MLGATILVPVTSGLRGAEMSSYFKGVVCDRKQNVESADSLCLRRTGREEIAGQRVVEIGVAFYNYSAIAADLAGGP